MSEYSQVGLNESQADNGVWKSGSHKFKVYGIVAAKQSIKNSTLAAARSFLADVVAENIEPNEEANGLGFVIIHPGDLGVSVLVHWWVQGSVLCQRVQRWMPESSEPIDMSSKKVVACVWELGLINAEQEIWRHTMMGEAVSESTYLSTRPDIDTV